MIEVLCGLAGAVAVGLVLHVRWVLRLVQHRKRSEAVFAQATQHVQEFVEKQLQGQRAPAMPPVPVPGEPDKAAVPQGEDSPRARGMYL